MAAANLHCGEWVNHTPFTEYYDWTPDLYNLVQNPTLRTPGRINAAIDNSLTSLDSKHTYFLELRKCFLRHEKVTEQALEDVVQTVANYSVDSGWPQHAGEAVLWFLQYRIYGVDMSGDDYEYEYDTISRTHFESYVVPTLQTFKKAAQAFKIAAVTHFFNLGYGMQQEKGA